MFVIEQGHRVGLQHVRVESPLALVKRRGYDVQTIDSRNFKDLFGIPACSLDQSGDIPHDVFGPLPKPDDLFFVGLVLVGYHFLVQIDDPEWLGGGVASADSRPD